VETLGAARLAQRIPEQRAVATIVPREEIAAVLEDREGSPELLLRIISDGPDRSGESSEIAMTWSRDELARILEEATGPNVVLTFDREELSHAIDDVEAHGLRERALVFAVAATGVLGTGASIANAMPATDVGGAVVTATAPVVSTAPSVTDVSSAGGYSTAAAATGAADTMVSDAASAAGYTAPAAVPEAAAAALGVTDVSSAGGYTAPAAGTGGSTAGPRATDVSSGGGYGTVEATSSSPGSISISRSDAVTDGLIAGGVLLAIAGATFASRRTGTARPA
jgi:hypothetical protein